MPCAKNACREGRPKKNKSSTCLVDGFWATKPAGTADGWYFLEPGATDRKLGGSCAVEKPDVGNAQFKPAAAKR